MDNNNEKKSFPWVIVIIIVIIIAAGLQWWQTKGTNEDLPNQDGASIPTKETPATTDQTPPATDSSANNPAPSTNNQTNPITKNLMHTITLETTKGTIVIETYDADAPKTVENFITLANKGFYNNLIFHRVIEGFMIQGGDPNGNGTGGPGYKFADELNPATESYKTGYVRGTVAMANAGPNTNGSQFFIMHKNYPLPNNYTIFGRVVKGIEVVDAIATAPKDGSDKPLTDIVIKKATVTTK